jgi:thymidylate synthase
MELTDNSAKQLWIDALKYIMSHGDEFIDSSGRTSKECLRLSLTLEEFSDVRVPIENLANYKKWLYPRTKEIESIILERDLGKSYAYSYGERIFAFGNKTLNQIDNFVIPILKKDRKSRRGIVTLWDPEKDSLVEGSVAPGLITIDFKIRKNKLHMSAIVRSNDIFIGWPANLYQLFCLGKYVAEKLDVPLGVIHTFSTSAHVFGENYDDIKELIK